ncbi:MAG TPA: FecR domain-containing protein [Herbaspirillum sp.]|jgi:transmembrane sensor
MKSASQIESRAADWIARRDNDCWSEEQQSEMDAWLNEATENRIAYLRLESVWRRADRLGSLHVPGRASVEKTVSPWSQFSTWKIAAGIVVAAALGLFLAAGDVMNGEHSYSTAIGESKVVQLADGSQLTLNTDTHLRTQVIDGKRNVWLESGEAYFEIAHDARHPFVVDAGSSRVTVLGTKFTVKRDAGHVDVMVVDGRVRVSAVGGNGIGNGNGAGAAGIAVITKDEKIVADNGNMLLTRKSPEEVANELGWRQGKLILDQMTLEQAAKEFNRYNVKQLVIEDPAVAQIRIGGSFNVNNVESFARLLQQGFGLKIEIGRDLIKIL